MAKEPAPPTFDEILNLALKITKALGCAPDEQARTFGYMQPVGNNPAYLKKVLKRTNHRALFNRCEIVCVIKAHIDTIFGEDHAAKVRFLRAQYVEHHGESMKSLMTSGELVDLEKALEIVEAAARTL